MLKSKPLHLNIKPEKGAGRKWPGISGLSMFWVESAAVLVIHAITFVIITWPFALSPLTRIIGWPGDNLQHLWSLWWAKHAWFDLNTRLWQVTAFYYPLGMDNPMVGATVWNQMLWLPVVLTVGPIVAYNAALSSAYILTGLTTYWLVLWVTRHRGGALFGSLAFAFCAARMSHIYAHLAYLTTYFIPLSVLALLWLSKRPDWKRAALLAATWCAAMLVNFKLIVTFLFPVSAVLALWQMQHFETTRLKWRYLISVAIAGLIAVGLWLIAGWPMLAATSNEAGDFLAQLGTESNSASLLGFLAPSWRNPLLPEIPALRSFLKQVNGFWIEDLVYIGIPTALLAVVGLRHFGRATSAWLALVVLCGVLALGPFLKIAGESITLLIEDQSHKVTLPWALLAQLPPLDLLRTPARLAQPMMLGLAILAGFGVAHLSRRLRGRPVLRIVIPGILAWIAVWEGVVVFPTRTFGPTAPPFFHQLATGGKPGAVLTFPAADPANPNNLAWAGVEIQMYHQTAHQRPMTSGFAWRVHPGVVGAVNQLQQAIDPVLFFDIVARPSNLADYLDSLGYAYVALYKDTRMFANRPSGLSAEDIARIRERLIPQLGAPVYEDEVILVFEVPDTSRSTPFVAAYRGWYALERQPDGNARRWSQEQATLWARAPISRAVQIEMRYRPLSPTQTLRVLDGDRALALETRSDTDGFIVSRSMPLEIGPTPKLVTLVSETGCAPIEPVGGRFRRCVAFYFSDIRLVVDK